jgi:hypothetical protein
LRTFVPSGRFGKVRTPVASLAVLLYLGLAPAAAHACSVIVTGEPSLAEKAREARGLIAHATAVIDGEVVRPSADGQPALVRAARVLKGPVQEFFSVGERDSCDIALTKVGVRLRLILFGGPDVYFLPVAYSNARQEDRILRSDRRRDWPYKGP